MSSEPYRQSLEDDDKPGGGQESVLEDGIIQTFTDHEVNILDVTGVYNFKKHPLPHLKKN